MEDDKKILKIGISSPEDIMYDDSFSYEFLNYLDKSKEIKTITWMEYETL